MNLDNEQLNALSAPDRERYMELERFFASKGWKIFQAMAVDNANSALMAGANAATWADNRVAYGNRSAWLYVLNLEQSTEQEFEAKAAKTLQAAEIARFAEESEYE
jgi:hypothetical protein